MEENKVADPKRRHFSKLHEKIQHKYEEMQRKMAKSKSVDTLSNISDEYNYKEQLHKSYTDLRESDGEEDKQSTCSGKTNQVFVANAIHQDLKRESTVCVISDFVIVDRDRKESEDEFFGDGFSRMSLESINEVGADSDGSSPPVTPQGKRSFRDRLAIAIENRKKKRREKEIFKGKKREADKKSEPRDKIEKYIFSNSTREDFFRHHKRVKTATVTIALIKATDLDHDLFTDEKIRAFFCRFRLGSEKYKSKSVKSFKPVIKWKELFNLPLYEDENMLEISLCDKDSAIAKSVIDLSELKKERTHKLKINMDCDSGRTELFILLTISGTSLVNTVVDQEDIDDIRQTSLVKKPYSWCHMNNETGEIGLLSVIVYGAKGLVSNETYCILQLGNERLQTQTESKTNDPNWMKIFSFPVNDITSIMEITVHDEKRSEDIAKISIPLLQIKNGEKKWYALKDVTQRERAKGNNARILLEMRVTWNILRASVRVLNPKEVKHLEIEEKLQRHIFARNLSRARIVINWILNAFRVLKTLFEWESRKLNVIALSIWLLFCWFFKIWMLPLLFLVPFYWNRPQKYVFVNWQNYINKELAVEIYGLNKEKEEKTKKEETTWRQKLNSLSDMVQTVQNGIGIFASYGESVKNLFNFTVPFLSYLAIFLVSIIALIMYMIPVKYMFMVWGIHKFTRKILRPNRTPNNEILDLLSRVPDDETLLDIQELPLEEMDEDVIN